MCAGGRGRAFHIHPCPSPRSSITPLISPSPPPPQSHRNLQRLLSAAHQTGLFFYTGLCQTFSAISHWCGCISPFFRHVFLNFLKNIFHDAFGPGPVPPPGWGQCYHQAGLPPSILLASSLHPLGCTTRCSFSVAALPFHFAVSFWILSSAVQSGAGRALAVCLGDDTGLLPPCLPAPLLLPQAAFFRL